MDNLTKSEQEGLVYNIKRFCEYNNLDFNEFLEKLKEPVDEFKLKNGSSIKLIETNNSYKWKGMHDEK